MEREIFEIKKMKVSDLKFIERNFRFMDKKTFSALVSNIKKDKFLTSTPLVMKKDDDYIIISGNHRVKACIDAGIDEIYCIVFDYLNVTEDDILRLQISHNLLSGKDDINILEELYNQIKDVTQKEIIGIDNAVFEKKEVDINNFLKINDVKQQELILLFFDEEIKEIEEKLNKIFEKNKKAILLKYSDYNIFLNKFLKIKEKEKVKNNSLAFKFLIEEVLKDEA